VAEAFGEAYGKAATIETAINSFRKCGIWPYNLDVFSEAEFAPAETTDRPLDHNYSAPPVAASATDDNRGSTSCSSTLIATSSAQVMDAGSHRPTQSVSAVTMNTKRGKGRGTVRGRAAGKVNSTASSTGRGTVRGRAAGTVNSSASGTGRGTVRGRAAGTVNSTASGTGRGTVRGRAADTVNSTASGTGRGTVRGRAAGTVNSTASGTGRGTVRGRAAGTVNSTASGKII